MVRPSNSQDCCLTDTQLVVCRDNANSIITPFTPSSFRNISRGDDKKPIHFMTKQTIRSKTHATHKKKSLKLSHLSICFVVEGNLSIYDLSGSPWPGHEEERINNRSSRVPHYQPEL